MTSSLAWVLSVCLLGSLISIGAAGAYLLLPKLLRDKTLDYLICFAIGMLLGASFLHLLPEAIEQAGDSLNGIMRAAVSAILAFFILEKGLIWRHHHHNESHPASLQADEIEL